MSRYSQSKSLPDEETPVAIQDLDLPNDPKIGAEYWVDIFQSLVIWTGNSWQRLYTPPASAQSGQVLYTTSTSSFIWTVPAEITSCSIVCVGQGGVAADIITPVSSRGIWGGGGGALSYINNVSVSAGEEILIDFPERNTGFTGATESRSSRVRRSDNTVICFAEAGGGATEGRSSESIGDQTYSGGTPTRFDKGSSQVTTNRRWFAAGGGSGSFGDPAGRGFSGTTTTASPYAGGGGTGLQGTTLSSSGQSFGAGKHGGDDSNFVDAGKYGGGGGAVEQYNGSQYAYNFGTVGTGAVRIIYGDDRSFPNDAEDV